MSTVVPLRPERSAEPEDWLWLIDHVVDEFGTSPPATREEAFRRLVDRLGYIEADPLHAIDARLELLVRLAGRLAGVE